MFLDTNILVYGAQGRSSAPHKFAAARRIVLEEDYGTSAQVLAEFYVTVTRNGAPPLTPEVAMRWVRSLSKKPCQPVDETIVRAGIQLSQRHQISYWDGAVIAAATRLGATTLYSEDLNHGQMYGSVRVVNPFAGL